MALLSDFIEKSYLNILKNIDNFEYSECNDPLIKQQKRANNELESLLFDHKNSGEILSKKDSILGELATLKEAQEKKLYQRKKSKYVKINMIKHLIKENLDSLNIIKSKSQNIRI
ncbi:hypothetical protein cpbgf_5002170 [Cryptosporidium parvum]|uniref:Uncharacterized protein n=1 Tax=Cryptosporidium parvum TaxID=5807 RepID=A0A7S7RG87_CRYPV|nr:hypothetical protein CPATCC_0023950 [Cryptosporidium parvum]WRK32361.1 hypothetical protein cpbgf_5002170 [Cryptosporidium parvum]|eukprot:QOY41649.1 hypothetical protein CPATCC_002226 [Cryptosporidium parvum]